VLLHPTHSFFFFCWWPFNVSSPSYFFLILLSMLFSVLRTRLLG
jgi:hypothetical protein